MTKRDVVKTVIAGKDPPYVPWSIDFTSEAQEKLVGHFGKQDLSAEIDHHTLGLQSVGGRQEDIGNGRVRDAFGVIWDRRVDKDIGVVENVVLPQPTIKGLELPDPDDPSVFDAIPGTIEQGPDCYRIFAIGFSLYERAWTLRGMENLMMDFIENPGFVHELLGAIADFNISQLHNALEFDIDAVYFGDDWGQQTGLQMGPKFWRKFIKPQLKRSYGVVRAAGKAVFIHSCGKVDELFDDLVEIGVNCFNPFQPEVMDVAALMEQYRGRLAFHGGLSTQKTLPYGTADDVRRDTKRLLELGAPGGYIFAPAHAVPRDVPLENMLAFIDVVRSQAGYRAPC